MGGRGTDVAREAASLVLLDDDFTAIVAAVKLGRRIFDNIRKAVGFTFAVHIPIAGLSLLPLFFPRWPLLLLPIHIVFLELVIDPSCALVFEAEEAEEDVMQRPPRPVTERLFSWRAMGPFLLQGATALGLCIAVYALMRPGRGDDAARGLTFVALVFSFLAIILTNRSWTLGLLASLRMPNPPLWWVVGGTIAFLTLVLAVPTVRTLFHFSAIHSLEAVVAGTAGFASVLWLEPYKRWRRPSPRNEGSKAST
jgi:Ca2+-transporting ATPase